MPPTAPSLIRANTRVPVTEYQIARYGITDRPRNFSPVAGEILVKDKWLEVPIGGRWIAAYRLAHSNDALTPHATILEVRIFPDENDRERPGEWSARVRGHQAQTFTPFSFERVHRHIIAKAFNSALAATWENTTDVDPALRNAFGPPTARHRPDRGAAAGRPGHPRTFYALLAVRYDAIEHNEREPRSSTRQDLQRRFYPKASLPAIGKWLSTARKLGFLTNVERGQRGSRATDLARRLVEAATRTRRARKTLG